MGQLKLRGLGYKVSRFSFGVFGPFSDFAEDRLFFCFGGGRLSQGGAFIEFDFFVRSILMVVVALSVDHFNLN